MACDVVSYKEIQVYYAAFSCRLGFAAVQLNQCACIISELKYRSKQEDRKNAQINDHHARGYLLATETEAAVSRPCFQP